MTIDYFLPAIGQQELLDRCVGHLVENMRGTHAEVHVIDNGSSPPLQVDRRFASLHRMESNLGMVEGLAFAMRESLADILVYSHTDFLIYEAGWDVKLSKFFYDDEQLGLIGAVGARVAAANGGREEVFCSFRDGHLHGWPTPPGIHPVALLDGCFMAFRRSHLDRIGIDRSFSPHHFYDKDWSLSFVLNGARVAVIDLDCEHLGGQTSCRPEYQRWANAKEPQGGDQAFYLANERRYIAKYTDKFPVRVHADWSFTTGV
jgi:GT2 family glycosyltransferase